MYEQIKARYEKGYVTDEQLARYVELGVISDEQAAAIKSGGSVPLVDAVPTADLDAAYQEGVNSYDAE